MKGGEKMRKIIAILTCAVILIGAFSSTVLAADESTEIMPRLNNVASVGSSFTIIDGTAYISTSYMGYPGITSSVRITIELQKRNLLVFWKDVTQWVVVSYEEDDFFEHTYQVESGTYRVRITYEVSGNGGTTDVIEEVLKDSY